MVVRNHPYKKGLLNLFSVVAKEQLWLWLSFLASSKAFPKIQITDLVLINSVVLYTWYH